jgi:hypothetical protein
VFGFILLKGRHHLENLGVDGGVIIKSIVKEQYVVLNGLVWLSIGQG